MRIKFAGSGSGKTSLSRFHSSMLIEADKKKILLDAGDSISRAMISAGISFNDPDILLLSHFHADHAGGLASLITQMKLSGRKKKLVIYTPEETKSKIYSVLDIFLMFPEALDFTLEVTEYKDNEEFSEGKIKILPGKNGHIYNKYNIPESRGVVFSSYSFLFSYSNESVFITCDIASASDLRIFDDCRYNTLVTEITHPDPVELIHFIAQRKIKNVILTHIGDEDEKKINSLKEYFKGKADTVITIARDGLELKI